MVEELGLEENTILAREVLEPMMKILDAAIIEWDVERLKATLAKMRSLTGNMNALPFPETMDKGELHGHMDDTFDLIIQLIEHRKVIQELSIKSQESADQSILKQLGF